MTRPDVSTWVELFQQEGQIERWLRFGAVADERIIDHRTRFVGFRPGVIFALVRWRGGANRAVDAKIAVLRAVANGESLTSYPFVLPGAEILLRLSGWARVRATLDAIDAIEQNGFRLDTVSPEHWRIVGSRIAVGLAPRPYDQSRHRAWRLRVRLGQ